MTSSSLFELCQGLIEKGNESWMSYFNKWETVAKYEEDIPEDYFCENSEAVIKPACKKKKKQLTQTKKRKTMSLITRKKNQKTGKKIIKKKRILSVREDKNLEQCQENKDEISEMLEANLKTFLNNFFKENQSKINIFNVLAFSSSEESNLQYSHQQALNFQLNKEIIICTNQKTISSNILNMNVSNSLVEPVRNTYNESLKQSLSSPVSHSPLAPIVERRRLSWANNYALADRYSRFSEPDLTSKINMTSRSNFFLGSPIHESLELKPLEWDFSHKSPVSVSRKINKEYFIKRTFSKMNITQDGKRFRNLCLHKRTNSVSLSMENSNLTTPERKPPERKCFSENVLQRKRRCPSKLFFDNEEDSESDGQTENPRPLIRCQNKKAKTQIISEVSDSDSEDYDSIFDKVGQS